jgi:DNA-binding NarL/FixJ family response regulator
LNLPRVLLVDDTPEILALCAEILCPDYEIVGEASDGESAIAAAERLIPDVVVLDISMPGLNGVEVAKRLRRSGCPAALVFLSGDIGLMTAALDLGGSAFVSKTRLVPDLPAAIQEALTGQSAMSISE